MQAPRTAITMMSEAGPLHIPADSGTGGLFRPFARGDGGQRTATPETLYDFFINDMPDPDEALRKDPDFLSRIQEQPDVVASMLKRTETVASLPETIEPNPTAPDKVFAQQVCEYVKWRWEMIPGRRRIYEWMQQAVIEGGAGHEWVWHRDADGSEWPCQAIPIAKSRFVFDRMGNLALKTREYPVWGAYVSPNPQNTQQTAGDANYKRFPPGKFTYHVHKQVPGRWEKPELEGYIYWGAGLDVNLYYPVAFDLFVWRYQMKWLEKFGITPTIIEYPENRPDLRNVARQIGQSLRGETIISVPRLMAGNGDNTLFKLTQMEVPVASYDAFGTFHELVRKKIENIILSSSEEGENGDQGGYSAHVSRRETGPQVRFGMDAWRIGDTINTQLFPPLCRSRFPGLPLCYIPVLNLKHKEEKDRLQEAGIAEKAVQLVPISKAELYERLGYKTPTASEETVFRGQDALNDGLSEAFPGKPGRPGEQPQDQQMAQATDEANPPAAPIGQGKDAGAGAVGNGATGDVSGNPRG